MTIVPFRRPRSPRALCAPALLLAGFFLVPAPGSAQEPTHPPASIAGRVTDAVKSVPIDGALVTVEGTRIRTLTDSTGRYFFAAVPAGPQTLRVNRIGYAPTHQSVDVPTTGALVVDLEMAASPLQLKGLTVTAEPVGRARGELGTATVVETDAIRNQTATSLSGILELLPGAVLQPPGLDGVQQVSLRAVPISYGGAGPQNPNVSGPTAQNLAAFGTQIVIDGVPQSNNANLQSLGPAGELMFATAAGGGIDLRRIPASTIERVEVIRGIPSARFGDLTQGVVLVDTRAGVVEPTLTALYDSHTLAASAVAGRAFGAQQTGTATLDVTRTMMNPGINNYAGYRLSAGLAHRLTLGGSAPGADEGADPRLVLDTRLDFYQLYDDEPATVESPNSASSSRDAGVQLSERARLRLGRDSRLDVTLAASGGQQKSFSTQPLLRGEMPFTSNLDTGLAVGHFIGGAYTARVDVNGGPRDVYGRFELTAFGQGLGSPHILRAGVELRREWNVGPGYQFDVEFPPQVTFNGVQGFDRPRRFDVIPPLVTSGFYLDDRVSASLGGAARLDVQAGLRLDLLHDGRSWLSGVRDHVIQPRLNIEIAPRPGLRLRAGVGRTAKVPALADLYPSPEYFDVVNVNWYANNPAERLAVLTTSILDPTNRALGYSVADRAELGMELDVPAAGAWIALTGFADHLGRAVGIQPVPTYLLRAHYQLSDSTQGTGVPPTIIQPPSSYDTVPAIINRPANNLTLTDRGAELIATFREIPGIRTAISVQGSWVWNRLQKDGVEFWNSFSNFQVSQTQQRDPYWEGTTREGELLLLTTRLIHHQPALGLVVTFTVQHTLRSIERDIGGTDTLAFAGYITRAGVLVPVPPSQRADPQYKDLHEARLGFVDQTGAPDWVLSLQVSKTLPLDGRLSFYAFNALDKIGRYGNASQTPLLYSPTRFGLEVTMPLAMLWRGGER